MGRPESAYATRSCLAAFTFVTVACDDCGAGAATGGAASGGPCDGRGLGRAALQPGVVAAVFGPLAEANINVDMIVQNIPRAGEASDLTFTVPTASLAHAAAELEKIRGEIGFSEILTDTNVVKVSAVGVGMRSNAGIAATMFKTLADRGINIVAITTSEIKVSVLIPEEYTELAVRVLHTAYGLDAEDAA